MILNYSDEAILEGLRQKKRSYIDYVYREYMMITRSIVVRKAGTSQDVEDVFQDAMLVLYQRAINPPVVLTCSLKTYFYSICRNIWMQRLDRKFRLLYQSDFEVHEEKSAYSTEEPDAKEVNLERRRMYLQHFRNLPADCQAILNLFYTRVPFSQIADMMHLRSEKYAKQKKYLCKNMLRKRIMKDPKCQQFMEYGNLPEME